MIGEGMEWGGSAATPPPLPPPPLPPPPPPPLRPPPRPRPTSASKVPTGLSGDRLLPLPAAARAGAAAGEIPEEALAFPSEVPGEALAFPSEVPGEALAFPLPAAGGNAAAKAAALAAAFPAAAGKGGGVAAAAAAAGFRPPLTASSRPNGFRVSAAEDPRAPNTTFTSRCLSLLPPRRW